MSNWINRQNLKENIQYKNNKSKKNGERLDEKYAKDLILQYVKDNFNLELSQCNISPKYEKWNPDYVLKFQTGEEIMLEITQGGVIALKDGQNINFSEYLKKCDPWIYELQKEISLWIEPFQATIIIFCDILNVKGINKSLIPFLSKRLKESFCDKNIFESEMHNLKIEGFECSARITKYYQNNLAYSPLKFISNSSADSNLLMQVKYSLELSLDKKEKIYKNFPLNRKWLAIINTHPIVESFSWNEKKDIYQEALRLLINKAYSFSKIFIIFPESPSSENILEINL